MPNVPSINPEVTIQEIENRSLSSPGLRNYIESYMGGQECWPLQIWDFTHLELAAWYYNPELDIARAQLQLAKAGILTAKMIPNPLFNFNPLHDSHLPPATSPWSVASSLQFFISRLIYRPYQIKEAQDKYLAAGFNYVQTGWNVRSQLVQSLIKLIYAAKSIALYRKQMELLQETVKLTEGRLSLGELSRLELRMALSSKYQVEMQFENAFQQWGAARIDLAVSLGLSICVLDEVCFDFPIYASQIDCDLCSLKKMALTHRADILEALYNYEAANRALQYEVTRQIPDLKLGPAYTYDQGVHEWGINLEIPLPLLDFNQGPIAEAIARRQLSASNFIALQTRVLTEIDEAIENYQVGLRKQEVSLAYLMENQKNQESARDRFAQGDIGRLELVNALVQEIVAQENHLTTLMDLQKAIANLEQVLQYPLNRGADILCD